MHTMVSSAGVGIAAPQVGKTVQLIVVASRPTLRYPHAPTMDPMAILNPQILSRSPELDLEWEGCLSIPGIRGLVVRSRRVVVAYLDRYGQAQEREFTGFPARIVQHEYDHLLGQVFLDRVESTQALISEQEYLKQMTP
jgi:peptide deformylase